MLVISAGALVRSIYEMIIGGFLGTLVLLGILFIVPKEFQMFVLLGIIALSLLVFVVVAIVSFFQTHMHKHGKWYGFYAGFESDDMCRRFAVVLSAVGHDVIMEKQKIYIRWAKGCPQLYYYKVCQLVGYHPILGENLIDSKTG